MDGLKLRRSQVSEPSQGLHHSPFMWLATFTAAVICLFYGQTLTVMSAPSILETGGDIVDTGYARYRGNRANANTVAYLGIPYAEPPLGELRFRAPVPLNTTKIREEVGRRVIPATEYPDFAIQGSTGGGDAGGAGSEDCLKINIYTPSRARRGSDLPVLVYIHGGGYIYGNPANWPFEHWIEQNPNVVIVSVYYRLSSFGFLAIPEFSDSANGDFNAGFLDQIEALRWVKRNIARFGGDPDRVTINGNSAGGASVLLHLVAETKEKLFSGAIAQSVYRTPLPTPEQQLSLFKYYAEAAGCGKGTVLEQLTCLRKAPVSALARAQDGATPVAVGSGYRQFHPVVDGKIIADFPTRLISQGKFARVPLIVGATTNETLGGGTEVPESLKRFFPSITDADIAALESAYELKDFPSEDLRYQALIGDVQLKAARSILGTAFSRRGIEAYAYRYNQRNPTNGGTGVWHASENWMMFRGTNTGFNGTTTFTPLDEAERNFARELIAYWLSFVRTGNPNTHKLSRSPRWPVYKTDSRVRIVLQQAQNIAASGSFVEAEEIGEAGRSAIIASQVDTQQN
ncbi:EstA protein [Coprinopsis marcescibilis]|uniref:Carboxylic ester hydrolase n=1 Tax=Coprinopsis marcescibilis TaxID=230819 RepID=A0A5C3L4A8_COPMA|nr:EstA protein [Coprinopsis marcescibilis]